MNSAVQQVVSPKFSPPACDHRSENSYAEALSRILEKVNSKEVYQKNIHVTISQIGPELQTIFVFKIGTPVIKCEPFNTDWMDRVLQLCIANREDAGLKEIARAITRIKANNQFSKLSNDLLSFDLRALPDIVLVALLRNTFSVRSQISCWNSLRDQIDQLLQERKRDSRLLLHGLKN
ncbi:MAG: hypothetical protein PHD43_21340 [Methylococcales bacterium]|nr:hypothetical protein [Methylococcales bacterium]